MATFDWEHLKQRARAGGTVPEGMYTLALTKAEAFESRKGNFGLKLRFTVADGPYADAMVYHTLTILPEYPNLMARFFSDLEALGVSETFLTGTRDLDDVADVLEQTKPTVGAKVESDEYNGRKNNKIVGELLPSMTSAGRQGFHIAPPPVTPTDSTSATSSSSVLDYFK